MSLEGFYKRKGSSDDLTEWLQFGVKQTVSIVLHPFVYARTLMQLGYEPIAPRPMYVFGRPVLILPNVIEYVDYIREVDGFHGVYRGLSAKLFGALFAKIISDEAVEIMKLPTVEMRECDRQNLTPAQLYALFKLNLKRDLLVTSTSLIASYPFHVISLRMMAQFMGRETIYKSVIGSIMEIYQSEGLKGFYSGLVPLLIYEVALVALTQISTYVVTKYTCKSIIERQYAAAALQYFYSTMLYPLQVVSTCTAISGPRLMAGRPPLMPIYDSWLECYTDLHRRGEVQRGHALIWRKTLELPESSSTLKNILEAIFGGDL